MTCPPAAPTPQPLPLTVAGRMAACFDSLVGILVLVAVLYGGFPWLWGQSIGVIQQAARFWTLGREIAWLGGLLLPGVLGLTLLASAAMIQPVVRPRWGLGVPSPWRLIQATSMLFGVLWLWAAALGHWFPDVAPLTSPLQGLSPGWQWIFGVGVLLIVPLAEEMLFRGVVQSVTVRQWGVVGGIVATAVLFGMLHAQYWEVPVALLSTWGLAVVFGAARQFTGSIWPGVLAHMLNNALVLATWLGWLSYR